MMRDVVLPFQFSRLKYTRKGPEYCMLLASNFLKLAKFVRTKLPVNIGQRSLESSDIFRFGKSQIAMRFIVVNICLNFVLLYC